MLKKILMYSLELGIAAAILWYDQRLFFLYFFFLVLCQIDYRATHLEKMLRIGGVIEELRILAIINYLKIPPEIFTKVHKDFLNNMPPEVLKSLEKDNMDIFGSNYIKSPLTNQFDD